MYSFRGALYATKGGEIVQINRCKKLNVTQFLNDALHSPTLYLLDSSENKCEEF